MGYLLILKNIGTFLFKNWKMTLAILVIGGLCLHELHNQHIISKLNTKVQTLEVNLANCQGALDKQNGIINTVRATGKKLLEEERVRAAKAIAERDRKVKETIAKLKDKPLADTCKAAMDELILESQGSLKWED